jgi:DnaK suppressor protein
MNLSVNELKTLKSKILSEQTRILESLGEAHEGYITPKEEIMDESDQAKYYYDQAQDIRFRNRELLYLKKLRKAQEKIESDDNYGECEECGCTIRFERLLARPTANLCIACKDESEREEKGNFLAKQSKSLGKTISLNA